MSDYLSGSEILSLLEKKATQGEELVVLTGSQWDAIGDAYTGNLFSRINRDALIFHPVKNVLTKETRFMLKPGVSPSHQPPYDTPKEVKIRYLTKQATEPE